MSVAITLVLIAILVALIVTARRGKAVTNKRPPLPGRDKLAKTGAQFHAVSIQSADTACEAAKAMEGKRFLAGATPRISLPECDVLECNCRFIHHDDRRRSEGRRGGHSQDMLGTTGGHDGKEQRHRGHRRDDDPQDFFSQEAAEKTGYSAACRDWSRVRSPS